MNVKYGVQDILLIVLGNFILAAGVAFFIIPNQILSGGVAGIAVAISPLLHIDSALLINIMTVVFFLAGTVVLGKNFALKTLISTIAYPGFLSLFSMVSDQVHITDNPIIASVYGGICIGMGVGLVYRSGASTGGMDIPPLIVHKYTRIPLATLVLITDASTVILGMSIHGIEAALIGLFSVFACSFVINKTLMLGISEAKSFMIISEKYEEILNKINEEVDRGATIIEAKGGYTKDLRPMLMVVVLKKQFPMINRVIQNVDPAAFVVIHDVFEVQGEGFSYYENKKKKK